MECPTPQITQQVDEPVGATVSASRTYTREQMNTLAVLAEVKAAQCPDPETRTFEVNGYLSDNQEFMDALNTFCDGHGQRLLLVAGCGMGKTKVILEDLATMRDGKNTILLAVPTSGQSDQNTSYKASTSKGDINVLSFTGNNNGSIEFNKSGSISLVYDSIQRADEATLDELANVVFVLDEAHEIEGAKNYRARILARLAQFETAVLKAGGNVIRMTATPRRIEGYPVDIRYDCIRVDAHGNRIKGITASRLVCYRKPGKKGSVKDLTIAIASMMVSQHDRPLIYLQDKRQIDYCKRHLEAQGLRVITLTANDKNYVTEGIVNDDGSVQTVRAYDNEAFGMLREECLLPEANVYLVTSVLEMGISIKGIKMDDGTVVQDPCLTPVYVCLRPDDFDPDNMRQYFARPRYPVNYVALIMNVVSGKSDQVEPDREDILLSLAAKAITYCNAYSLAPPYRADVPTIQGDIEKACVRDIGSQRYEVDYARLISESCGVYYRQLYNSPDYVIKALEDEFEIPVELVHYNKVLRLDGQDAMVISDRARTLLSELARSPTFERDVLSERGNSLMHRIVREPGGRKVIERIKRYAHGGLFDNPVEIVSAAIEITLQPRASLRRSNGTIIDNPDRESILAIINRASEMTTRKGQVQQWALYYDACHNRATDSSGMTPYSNTSCIPDDLLNDLIFIVDTPEMLALMRLWKATNYEREWKTVCKEVIGRSVDEVKRAAGAVLKGKFAGLHYDASNPNCEASRKYVQEVMPFTSVAGAQYHTLRYTGKGFYYPDKQYADEPDEEIRRQHSSYHFAGTFVGKTFCRYDVQMIAQRMNRRVHELYATASENRYYSEQMMLQTLRDMFVCSKVDCKDEDGYRYRVRNLRIDGTSVIHGNRPTREQVIIDLDDCLISDMTPEEKRVATFDASAMLEAANVPTEQAEVLSNRISAVFNGNYDAAVAVDNNVPYEQGILQALAESIDESVKVDVVAAEPVMVTVKGTAYTVDPRAIPPLLSYYPEEERSAQSARYQEALRRHEFYWQGQWYRLPHDAGTDVPDETAHFWNTGYLYDDWIRSMIWGYNM